MNPYDVVIIGAGHNGLACAALLAKGGARVAVAERRTIVGGAAVSESDVWPGYTVSTASYVCSLLDPWLVSELELRAHGYDVYRKDPQSFTPLADGRSLLLGADRADNAREISAFNPSDVAGFHAFDDRANQLGGELFETFSENEPRFDRFASDVQTDLLGSAATLVERHVRTPVLQAMLANDGLVGTNLGPRNAGTGYVLAHHYAGRALGVQGAWGYVHGGMGAISQALAAAARVHGVDIFTNKHAARIEVRDGRAQRVVFADGSEIKARTIASNAHPRTTFLDLVGREHLEPAFLAKLEGWRTIGPVLKLNLAIGELPNFTCRPGTEPQPHHRASIHVAPSLEYLQRAFEDGRSYGESREPLLEAFLQTPTDPSLAPPRKHILSVFAQYFPYDRADGWTRVTREGIADKIVAQLGRYAPNLPNVIEARQSLAPPDLEERFGLVGGHIFHGELLPGQIYEQRFATRTPIPGLFLCGSGAHPGGCVSGFPGKRAAAAIVRELQVLA